MATKYLQMISLYLLCLCELLLTDWCMITSTSPVYSVVSCFIKPCRHLIVYWQQLVSLI